MKCQNLCSGKNKKNISICHQLKILPRNQSMKEYMQKTIFVIFTIEIVFTRTDYRQTMTITILSLSEISLSRIHRSRYGRVSGKHFSYFCMKTYVVGTQ